jgi:hypothetical protein
MAPLLTRGHTLAGVTETDIDAFVLTARLFVQDHDGISFRRVVEIYESPYIPWAMADRFRDARKKWIAYLDLQPGMAVNVRTLTNYFPRKNSRGR